MSFGQVQSWPNCHGPHKLYICVTKLRLQFNIFIDHCSSNASQPKWFSTSVQVFNKELGSTCQHFSLRTSCQNHLSWPQKIPITWNQHFIFFSTLNNFSVIWVIEIILTMQAVLYMRCLVEVIMCHGWCFI